MSYEATRACALALLAGKVLHAGGLTAGNGKLLDWRTVKSGATLLDGGSDAYEHAALFVAIVGAHAALEACGVSAAPVVVAFMATANGGRRRSFEAAGFTVYVEPHGDDRAQEAFTKALAARAADIARLEAIEHNEAASIQHAEEA